MTTKVIIPKGGMGTTEGTIARWLRAEGDHVEEGEIIVEIETAKAMIEVPAPASGVLRRILPEGHTAEVYSEIAVID